MIKVTTPSGVTNEFHGATVETLRTGVLAVITPAGGVVYPAGEWETIEYVQDAE